MKKLLLLTPILALTIASIALQGCNRSESPSGLPGKPGASTEKNSFGEVTAQLEPGGSLYLYLSTEQLLAGVSDKLASVRQVFDVLPNVGDKDKEKLGKVFDVVTSLIKDSGFEDISGFGASSVMHEPGLYHSKTLLHHYKGKGSGFLWTMFGQKPHALDGLNMLPASTAVAYFGDIDVKLLWSTIQKEVSKAGIPEAEQALAKVPQEFEKATQLNLDKVLNSLDGEFGFALMLDDGHKLTLPIPNLTMDIPEPSLLLAIKVKDDTIFNRLEELMKQSGQQVINVDKPNLKMRTLPVPLPLPIQLRPTIARSEGYLLIASSDSVIQQALAVKGGQAKGLKAEAEFQRLSKDVPLQGNHFSFVSQRFGGTLIGLQQQAMQMMSGGNADGAKTLQSLFGTNAAGCGFCVSANTDEGWLKVGNGNQHPAKVFLAATVAPVAIGAAMALPALAKAKEKAQTISCISNLKQIDLAKRMWATDNNKGENDTPSAADLAKYLANHRMPTCPSGGSYTINAVSQAPECSVSGHVLSK